MGSVQSDRLPASAVGALVTSFVECDLTWFRFRRANLCIFGKFNEFSQNPLNGEQKMAASPWQPIYSNISALLVSRRHRDVRGSHSKLRLTRQRVGWCNPLAKEADSLDWPMARAALASVRIYICARCLSAIGHFEGCLPPNMIIGSWL